MRARDVARPDDDDLAAAEQELVIRHARPRPGPAQAAQTQAAPGRDRQPRGRVADAARPGAGGQTGVRRDRDGRDREGQGTDGDDGEGGTPERS
jgi:hypothetical protein